MTGPLITVEDARQRARRRLPKIFFDYIDGGSFSEATLRANETDFERYALVQRVLVDARERDLTTHFLGRTHAMPFGLGPVGYTGLFSRSGEIAAARAAAAAGIPFCLSNFAIATLAEVRQASGASLFMQLYVLRDRSMMETLIEASVDAGADALVLTVDTAVTALRERDERNGFRGLTRITPRLALQFATKPRWCAEVLAGGLPQVGVARGRPEYGSGVLAQSGNLARQIEQGLTWADLRWLRDRWRGRLVVKGILSAEDARRAVAAGADAIVVSNHGGRQLDGAPSTISVLRSIAEAVGMDSEVLLDGGIRRGAQIVKALALGAHGVLLGRAYAYGLAANGQSGVAAVIELLRREIDLTMALMGVTSVRQLREGGVDLLIDRYAAAMPAVTQEPSSGQHQRVGRTSL
ncbi:MAG: alpha-hydroxy acid oxidase [Janthinobacterium lividum]